MIVLILACAAACTSSGDGTKKSSDAASPSDPVTSVPSSTPTSVTPTTPTAPATPTVPADVPTTGPNTKPGEQPPVMPVAATKHTPDGAKAFAEFFIKTIDWGYATDEQRLHAPPLRQRLPSNATTSRTAMDRMPAQRDIDYVGGRFAI